jgi:ubiquinone/menaquinone biosynthesis C-methylase UbiE
MQPTSTDDVFDLMDSHIISAALNAAMELGLFWLIDDKPMTTEQIAENLYILPHRCEYWLGLLRNIGLLRLTSLGHTVTDRCKTTILDGLSQESWRFLARESISTHPVTQDMSKHLKDPGSVYDALELEKTTYVEKMIEDPNRTEAFTRMLFELHLGLADQISSALSLKKVQRMMDLGGGSGVVSLALLRDNPQLTSVIVDIENVCNAGRKIIKSHSHGSRIRYQAANFMTDDLPTDFDLIMYCDIGFYDDTVFAKIKNSLRPNGKLVVVHHLFKAGENLLPPYSNWAFISALRDLHFRQTSEEMLLEMLIEKGFRITSHLTLPEGAIKRWSAGWKLLEAVVG